MKPAVAGDLAVEVERPPAPRFGAERLAAFARAAFGLEGEIAPLDSSIDQNARLTTGDGRAFVLKVANRSESTATLDLQNAVMARLDAREPGIGPQVVPSLDGNAIEELEDEEGRPHAFRVVTFLEGPLLPQAFAGGRIHQPRLWESLGELVARIGRALEDFDHPAAARPLRWDLAHAPWILRQLDVHESPERRAILERVAAQFLGDVDAGALPQGTIHGDVNEGNVVLDPHADPARVAGVFDFGDTVRSARVFDLAIAAAYALLQPGEPLETLRALVAGYERVRVLEDAERRALWPALRMRLAVSVTVSALDARTDPDNAYLTASQGPAWEALERMASITPREAADAVWGGAPRAPGDPKDELAERRRARLGPSLSLSYREPLEIVRGRGVFLFDEEGRAHLDCVNNVCHVGHCHPQVVDALCEQARTLNTNTRYLHESVVRYAERLTGLLPDPLEVCFFVNSGSEANELALRLARTATGRSDVVVLEAGYHGHTGALVDLSHYKHAGPGGGGAPEWVHAVPLPDGYRGRHRGDDEATGTRYAEYVGEAFEACAARGRPGAAFLAEPIIGCGGQVVPPPGFLRSAYAHARAAGAVCIADEVQVGFGRVGTHWWAFEQHDVVPDVVTLGKPIGNGHPLAAVVTTRAIADAFVTGMEFFSTFGGNPVSAAVGLAVLDVIEGEDLRANALARGTELRAGFEALARRHPTIGDVRGSGLYLGVAIVRDRASREPAPEVLADAVEHARREGVLLSIDGPQHDVLKVKPPIVFDADHVTLLLGAFERGLGAAERAHGIGPSAG